MGRLAAASTHLLQFPLCSLCTMLAYWGLPGNSACTGKPSPLKTHEGHEWTFYAGSGRRVRVHYTVSGRQEVNVGVGTHKRTIGCLDGMSYERRPLQQNAAKCAEQTRRAIWLAYKAPKGLIEGNTFNYAEAFNTFDYLGELSNVTSSLPRSLPRATSL